MQKKNITNIAIVLGVIVFLLIGWAVYRAVTVKGQVTFYIAPSTDVQLTINGKVHKKISTETKMSVTSLNLAIKASRDGFTEQTVDYVVDQSKGAENIVYIILQPTTKEARELMRTDAEASNAQYVSTNNSLVTAEKIRSKNPILSKLPHYGLYYTISQGVSEKNASNPEAFALYIDYIAEQGKSDAIEYLKSQGEKPENYELIYRVEEYKDRTEEQ